LPYDNYYYNDDVHDEEHGHNYSFFMFFFGLPMFTVMTGVADNDDFYECKFSDDTVVMLM
jgi:hypothetical protein